MRSVFFAFFGWLAALLFAITVLTYCDQVRTDKIMEGYEYKGNYPWVKRSKVSCFKCHGDREETMQHLINDQPHPKSRSRN